MRALTPKQLSTRLTTQLTAVSDGIEQAIAWVETNRPRSPRLEMEADTLAIKLRRHRNKAQRLADSAGKEMAIGLFGQAQEGKTYLISSLAAGENGLLESDLGGHTLDYQAHINPESQPAGLVTRFTRQPGVKNATYPVQLLLLSEADIVNILAQAHLATAVAPQTPRGLADDEQQLADQMALLAMHRQPEAIPGFSSDEVIALWDSLARHDGKRQKWLETHFWPAAITLTPALTIDDRARLFSVLWQGKEEYTAAYRQFAHTLQRLNYSHKVLAPLSVLVDDVLLPTDGIMNLSTVAYLNTSSDPSVHVCPVINNRASKPVELSLAELAFLSVELVVTLQSPTREPLFEQVDLLDIPGFNPLSSVQVTASAGNDHGTAQRYPVLVKHLLHAKASYLLERYTEQHAINLLMVCTAVDRRADVKAVGKALDYWVKQTQGETAQQRSQHKPGLIWAVTKFDQLVLHNTHYDEGVQRYVGNPGESWGTMLATDERGVKRMANWLDTEVKRETKLARLSEQLHDMQNELSEHILGGWYQSDSEISAMRKQKVAESVLKSLQTRPGVHGELLELMLPTRDELRRLYQQQRQTSTGNVSHPVLESATVTNADPFGIGMDIDLFSDAPLDIAHDDAAQTRSDVDINTVFARQVLRFWINHMRNLPDNAPLVELLGLGKPTLEMLMEEIITAGLRQGISQVLHATLNQDDHPSAYSDNEIDSQVSRALTVLGDFVAWLGFQNLPENQRPESRINRGRKIFAKPEKQAISWGAAKRLTKLSLTPTNNTAFYVYDWLVGLNTLILQNAGHSAGGELYAEQRKQLGAILQIFKPTPAGAK
ncbi:MAG: putative virulence factor [Symbiopectobacterium sp.]|uniref:putative virulence factor n=1 Tax=Symbiopectobacterium sp. TaxID=2952789 RepID=UPI0039E9D2FA